LRISSVFWSCCGMDATAVSQPPQKKHQQIILIWKGPEGVWEKFPCVLVMLGSGCYRHFTAASKKAPAKVLRLERSGGCLGEIRVCFVNPRSGCHRHFTAAQKKHQQIILIWKGPEGVWENFPCVLVMLGSGCHRHFTAASKKAPAKVLKLERSGGCLRNFECVLVMLGSGCHRRFPASTKKAPANNFNLERSGGGLGEIFMCFGHAGKWMPPALHSRQKKSTSKSWPARKVRGWFG